MRQNGDEREEEQHMSKTLKIEVNNVHESNDEEVA